jgi:hypothetical protein
VDTISPGQRDQATLAAEFTTVPFKTKAAEKKLRKSLKKTKENVKKKSKVKVKKGMKKKKKRIKQQSVRGGVASAPEPRPTRTLKKTETSNNQFTKIHFDHFHNYYSKHNCSKF